MRKKKIYLKITDSIKYKLLYLDHPISSSKNCSSHKSNLFDLVSKLNQVELKKNSKEEFIDFEGSLLNEDESSTEKAFSIQIGATSWKEADSDIIIILTDISPVKNYFSNQSFNKDQLLATVSHELRTPLNGILGPLELASEEATEEPVREKVNVALISEKLL